MNVLKEGVEAVLGGDEAVLGKVLKIGDDLIHAICQVMLSVLKKESNR